MSVVDQILVEVQDVADGMGEDVLLRLLDALERQGDRVACRKHGALQSAASVAAVRLWRMNRRGFFTGKPVGEMEYHDAIWARTRTSQAYHAETCTCHAVISTGGGSNGGIIFPHTSRPVI